MENTTENSGALAELRPVKFPEADGYFFSSFVPEVAFACGIGVVVAVAAIHFAKLFETLSKPQAKTETALEKAKREISEMDAAEPECAREIWIVLRKYLMVAYGNPFFPNMTASEAIRAMDKNPTFAELAVLVRTIEYSPLSTPENRKRLQEDSLRFLTNEKNG